MDGGTGEAHPPPPPPPQTDPTPPPQDIANNYNYEVYPPLAVALAYGHVIHELPSPQDEIPR